MEQTQQQGERRQSQKHYQGEDRRKHDASQDITLPPSGASTGMSTQERKDEQAERARQQHEQGDQH